MSLAFDPRTMQRLSWFTQPVSTNPPSTWDKIINGDETQIIKLLPALTPRPRRCIVRSSRSHPLTGQALWLGLDNNSNYIQSLLLNDLVQITLIVIQSGTMRTYDFLHLFNHFVPRTHLKLVESNDEFVARAPSCRYECALLYAASAHHAHARQPCRTWFEGNE